MADVETKPERATPAQPIAVDFTVTLKALVHPGEDSGYWAEVPSLPGCFTQGDTMEEIQANLREAAEGWLEAKADLQAMRDEGRL